MESNPFFHKCNCRKAVQTLTNTQDEEALRMHPPLFQKMN